MLMEGSTGNVWTLLQFNQVSAVDEPIIEVLFVFTLGLEHCCLVWLHRSDADDALSEHAY